MEYVVPGAPDVEVVPDPLEVQVPVIRDVLAAFGISVVGADGYEADDVIGTLATDAGMPVDVVTGDRDLFQLVDDDAQVRILYIARGVGRHERVTNSVVREKYGIDGRQYADFAALRGDPSDGLPGVNGIGEKTATTLLQRFGSIEGIQAAVEDPDSNMAPSPRRRIRRPRTTSSRRRRSPPSPVDRPRHARPHPAADPATRPAGGCRASGTSRARSRGWSRRSPTCAAPIVDRAKSLLTRAKSLPGQAPEPGQLHGRAGTSSRCTSAVTQRSRVAFTRLKGFFS